MPGRDGNQLIDERRRDSRRIGSSQLPFLAKQSRDFVPVLGTESLVHGPCYFRDALEIPEYALVAVDMSLKNFPVVDARLAGRPGVRQHESRLNLLGQDWNNFAVNSVGIKTDGAHATVERRIVILTAGRHFNDLGFDVLGNNPHLLEREIAGSEARQRRRGGNHQSGRTRNSRSGWRFGVGLNQYALLRRKELKQPGGDGQPELISCPQVIKIRKMLLATCIQRAQMNSFGCERRHSARGQDVDRKVEGHCPRMKKIKRPKINRSPGEIGAAGGLRDNCRAGRRETVFFHGVVRNYMSAKPDPTHHGYPHIHLSESSFGRWKMAASGPKVLFLDDEENIRLTLGMYLEDHGFIVTSVATVPEALRLITQQTFDVLIADLNVGSPGDGFTVVSAMRRTQPQAVTFILTGYPAFETALEAIRLQVDDYITKPTDTDALVLKIRTKLSEPKASHHIEPRRLNTIISENIAEITADWLKTVRKDPELGSFRLSDAEIADHVPRVLSATIRVSGGEQLSEEDRTAARDHGITRRRQGYGAPLLLRESRLLDDAIGRCLQKNLLAVQISYLITDLIAVHRAKQMLVEESLAAFLARGKK